MDEREARMVKDATEFLATAQRMLERFKSDPKFHVSMLYSAREQAWQASRGISELAGRVTKPDDEVVVVIGKAETKRIQELETALERLGGMEAFETPRTIGPHDQELLARIDYARTVLKRQG